jgi:aconitate hydratase
VRANYLASPPLVVAYALAGDMNIDLTTEPLGQDKDGNDVYLKDIWPTQGDRGTGRKTVTREAFQSRNTPTSSRATRNGRASRPPTAETYDWPATSTYVQNPPYFQGMGGAGTIEHRGRQGAGDPGRHDHHRPHLARRVVQGHHACRQVPDRTSGAGARVQLLRLAPRQPRGHDARHLRQHPHQERDAGRASRAATPRARRQQTSIFDAAMAYQEQGTPLVVFGGEQYGAGSSRDWAAKGTAFWASRP